MFKMNFFRKKEVMSSNGTISEPTDEMAGKQKVSAEKKEKNIDKQDLLITELRQRLADVPPLEDEKDYLENDETLARFLRARDWKIVEAEKLIRGAIEWRRENKPRKMDCNFCHDRPGYHSMRQVGHDKLGRPVIYASFTQAATCNNCVEDAIAHMTYLIENAKLSMGKGVSTWVFIIDCTGLTLTACNPKLGYGATQVMSNVYPERLGQALCVNHGHLFHGVWKTVRVFLHPNTVSKMKLVKSKRKYQDKFLQYFSDELTNWLIDEIRLNKQRPTPASQLEFWKGPINPMHHDPRGCPSYIQEYIDMYPIRCSDPNVHKPHPNIIDFYLGSMKEVKLRRSPLPERDDNQNNSDEDEDTSDVHISEEFQIPKDAKPVYM